MAGAHQEKSLLEAFNYAALPPDAVHHAGQEAALHHAATSRLGIKMPPFAGWHFPIGKGPRPHDAVLLGDMPPSEMGLKAVPWVGRAL